jgi:4-hydroxy-tetrahydrodipicolinate synthase
VSDRLDEGSWVEALTGIVPSLNTPFTTDDRIDRASLERLVDHVAAAGCPGFLALAVAGESAALSEAEWREVAATLLGHAAGRLRGIVSVTADDQTVRLARAGLAKDLGADAILCQPPAEGGPAERLEVLSEVAAAGPPVLMIQDLDWQGPGLALHEIVALTRAIPRFRCLKIEVVPAGPKYSAVLEATGGRLHVSGGWAVTQMIDGLERGVHAFMPTELEPVYVAIHRLHSDGQAQEARALFGRVLPILTFCNQDLDTSIQFLKRLRQANGIFTTARCRVPALDPARAEAAELMIARARALLASL